MNKIDKGRLRNFIGSGKTEQAIKELLVATAKVDESLQNQVTNLQGQYNELRNEKIAGVLSKNESSIEHARINRSLLNVISLLPDEYPDRLKKNTPNTPTSTTGSNLIVWIGAIAACLLMLVGYIFWENTSNLTSDSEQKQEIGGSIDENNTSTALKSDKVVDNSKKNISKKDKPKSSNSQTSHNNTNQQDTEKNEVITQTQQVKSPKHPPTPNTVTVPTNTPISTSQVDKTPTKVAQVEKPKETKIEEKPATYNITIRASDKVAKVLLNGEEKLKPNSRKFTINRIPEGDVKIKLLDKGGYEIAVIEEDIDSTTVGFSINSNGHVKSLSN